MAINNRKVPKYLINLFIDNRWAICTPTFAIGILANIIDNTAGK